MMIDSVIFTGIMDHKKLSFLLPHADILIAPSVFPEAFGMVAIEALASGVYPIITYQSAFKEIVEEIKTIVRNYSLKVEHVNPDEDVVIKIFRNVDHFFKFRHVLSGGDALNLFKKKIRDIAFKRYSWPAIASQYIDHYKR
jgi:glycosyltransferase involved in cell wall biosynthesis